MTRLDSVQDGCWVNLTYPSEDEAEHRSGDVGRGALLPPGRPGRGGDLPDKHIITVCLKETSILKDFQDGLVRFAETQKRTSFILYKIPTHKIQFFFLCPDL